MSTQPIVGDVRELLGLRTPAARLLVGWFVLTYLVVFAVTPPADPAATAVEALAWLLVSAAAYTFIRAPGDPLPLRWTWLIAVAGPIASTLVLAVIPYPIDTFLQTWPLSATAALSAYLAVRGRVWWGWASTSSAVGACIGWAVLSGQGAGYGAQISLINFAPLIMASFFVLTIRPAAREIFELRRRATEAAAAGAAQAAVLEERDRQLARLDERARPMLERLTDETPVAARDRLQCALVEAQLRDSLRAPILDVPAVADAAGEARTRGVDVVLLDDHGLDGAPREVRERIVDAVVTAIEDMPEGVLTVRVLPPGRDVAMTIVRTVDQPVRSEFNSDGRLVTTVG
ncbi:hypothetical protein C6V83_01260 [Gordonia iterans]|uniref:Histidine kinase n=1 Tax=Gordonia iterans TaxID=1004901 RepID=A0A2S0KBQ7_9ACTN|nr:hypothetical protein [Gordonia iterans]AVL99122.1 hypothetical protein C6V83_01260 [Gordonia iterans]